MFRARAARLHRILVPFVSGAILWSLIATAAFAADKAYSAVFVGTSVLDAGGSYGADSRPVFKIQLKNESTQARFGSANITAPVGVALTNASMATGSPGTATPVGNVIQARNMNLAPGTTATINVSAQVECASNPQHPYTWTIDSRQANDFNGVGNELTPLGPLTNTITGACSVEFTKQPAHSLNAPDAITSETYKPNGAKVEVRVKAAGPGETVKWWSGTVTLSLGVNPGVPNPGFSDGTPISAANGVFQFAPKIAVSASGYGLTATAAPDNSGPSAGTSTTGVPSSAFNIVDDAEVCTSPGSSCDAHASNAKTDVVVLAQPGGAANDVVILSINDPTTQAPDCAGYTETSDYVVFDVQTSTGGSSTRAKTITLTLFAANVTKSASKYQVCFEGPSGPPAQLLTMCASKNPALPCMTSRGLDKDKNLVIVVAAPGGGGDPKSNW
jgi:hypothetical protein